MTGKRNLAVATVTIFTTFVVVGFIFGGGNGTSAEQRTPLSPAAAVRLTTTVRATTPPVTTARPTTTTTMRPTTTTTVRPTTTTTVRPTTTTAAPTTTTTNPYAIRAGLVAVSPASVKSGRIVQVQIDKFPPTTVVTVKVTSGASTALTFTLTTNSRGIVNGTFTAPAKGNYTVTATCGPPTRTSATTKLTVT